MKKYLILYTVIVTVLLVYGLRYYRVENQRLSQNQTALSSELRHYRTRAGEEAASAQVLRLRCGEFEELRAVDAARIKNLGIKLRRLESTATTATATVVELRAALRDTVVMRMHGTVVGRSTSEAWTHNMAENPHTSNMQGHSPAIVADTLRLFRWRDPWITVEGTIDRDSVACRVESIDTLRQIIHRIPRRFLFIRWGTKALQQEVVSSNPHTRIVYSEYITIER